MKTNNYSSVELTFGLVILSAIILGCVSGGAQKPPSALDQYIFNIKTNQAQQIDIQTHVVTVTNYVQVPELIEQIKITTFTNIQNEVVTHTNQVVLTNFFTQVSLEQKTNYTSVTNLVNEYTYTPKPVATDTASTVGTIINTFVPGIGGLVSTALVGALGIWARLRSRKANEALLQSVQTTREMILQITNDPAVDQRLKDWLIAHQKEEGVFNLIAGLVEKYRDKPKAKEDAIKILTPLTPPAQYVPQFVQARGPSGPRP